MGRNAIATRVPSSVANFTPGAVPIDKRGNIIAKGMGPIGGRYGMDADLVPASVDAGSHGGHGCAQGHADSNASGVTVLFAGVPLKPAP